MLFSLTLRDVDRLYADPTLHEYRPQAVLAELSVGGVVPALCYNLPRSPEPRKRNPEYATKLREVARRLGLPAEYVEAIE